MTMQKMEATSRMVDMHAVQHGYSILCLDAENAYFHAEEDEEVYCWPPKEWVERYHARGGRVEHRCLKLKGQLYGRRNAAKKLDEFVVAMTGGLGTEQRRSSAVALQATRNNVDDSSIAKTISAFREASWT